MQDTIEKLLILQDCDRRLMRVKSELARVGPDRKALQAKADGTAANLEGAKLRGKQLESARKKLELDVEAKKQQISRYAMQQFETRKNEEYRALQHEIDGCKAEISKIEDRELELMEQGETATKQVAGPGWRGSRLARHGSWSVYPETVASARRASRRRARAAAESA